jgi:hypothetical protein
MLRMQEIVGKAELETVGITDDPKVQLVPFPSAAGTWRRSQSSLVSGGSIDAR